MSRLQEVLNGDVTVEDVVLGIVARAYSRIAIKLGCKEYHVSVHVLAGKERAARHLLTMYFDDITARVNLLIKDGKVVGGVECHVTRVNQAGNIYAGLFDQGNIGGIVPTIHATITAAKYGAI